MSVAEGLPTMGQLGTQVVERLRYGTVPADVIDAFESEMHATDFEKASDLDVLNPYVHEVRDAVHAIVLSADISAYERLLDGNTRPMRQFLAHFKLSRTYLDIITSNYDRLIEFQCGLEKIPFYTGFYGGYIGGFDESARPHHWPDRSRNEYGVVLYKVHGSVDWFRDPKGDFWRLPLRRSVFVGHEPLIIVPGRSKFETGDLGIHRSMKQLADAAIRRARAFVALGYGFNDPQLDDRLCSRVCQSAETPLLVLARTLTDKVRERLMGKAKNYTMIEREDDAASRVWSSDSADPTVIPVADLWTVKGLLGMIS